MTNKLDHIYAEKQRYYLGGKMPREQRDTLYLLAVIFIVFIPHFFYIPIWATAITLSMLAWRAWVSQNPSRKQANKIIIFCLLIFLLVLTLLSYKSIFGPEAGGCLLVMLTALKTLELKARRDAVVIFYLGFFLIMLSLFQSQNILTAVALLFALTGLIAALVNAHMPAGTPTLKETYGISIRLMLWGAPIMVFLFLTFPRLDPLWAMPDATLTKTGVSGELTIGSISQLVEDHSVAFRVRFTGENPPRIDQMYFRGPVLTSFDGQTWRARKWEDERGVRLESYIEAKNNNVTPYEITMESTNQPWLFTLDMTMTRPALTNNRFIRMADTLQWSTDGVILDRVQYQADASFDYRAEIFLTQEQLQRYTYLPQNSNPRTQAWAQELLKTPSFNRLNTQEKSQWLLNYIQQQNFFYTLSPPAGYKAASAADQLWFDYKSGFCEHYSYAFTILMRSMDIPTRIVTGYQGAEQNYVDDYWVVRQSNAHAWTEVWQENEGWIRVDPTHAIAPNRILYGSLNDDAQASSTRGFAGMGIVDKLLMRWDAIENKWNMWVIAYNADKGISLLERIGFKSPTLLTWVQVLSGLLLLVSSLWLIYLKWLDSRKDPWLRVFHALLDKLQKAGVTIQAHHAPRTIAESIKLPKKNQQTSLPFIKNILYKLEELRYAANTQAPYQQKKELEALKVMISKLKL